MSEDEDTQQTGRPARALAVLTVVALGVAILVLLIDQQLKREIIAHELKARRLLDEAQALAEGMTGDGPRAGNSQVPDSSSGDAPDLVDGGAGLAAETGSDDSHPSSRAANGTAASRRRARRDGG